MIFVNPIWIFNKRIDILTISLSRIWFFSWPTCFERKQKKKGLRDVCFTRKVWNDPKIPQPNSRKNNQSRENSKEVNRVEVIEACPTKGRPGKQLREIISFQDYELHAKRLRSSQKRILKLQKSAVKNNKNKIQKLFKKKVSLTYNSVYRMICSETKNNKLNTETRHIDIRGIRGLNGNLQIRRDVRIFRTRLLLNRDKSRPLLCSRSNASWARLCNNTRPRTEQAPPSSPTRLLSPWMASKEAQPRPSH